MPDPVSSPPDGNAAAKAAWYPDPLGVSEYRYWDGQRWTNQVTRAKGSGPSLGGIERGELIVGIGGLVLGISPFLAWASVIVLGRLNLFQLLDAGGHGRGLAWLLVLAGAG